VSGKRYDFNFLPSTTIGAVKQHVFANWPQEWQDEKVGSVGLLRIVNKGRFLDDSVTLESEKLTPNTVTVMHLVPKPEKIETEEPPAEKPKEPQQTTKCFCIIL